MLIPCLLSCLLVVSAIAGEHRHAAGDQPVPIISLHDEQLQLRVAPTLGGRLIDLRLHGRDSVIRCNWDEIRASGGLDQIAEQRAFVWWYRGYLGQSLWIGPQRDFWQDQNYFPDHAGKEWPPDPFHSWGDFRISEQSESVLALVGPVSQLNGLQVSKRYELLGEGRLRITYDVHNRGEQTLRRNCWPLTRVAISTRSYVDVAQIDRYWLDHRGRGSEAAERRVIPHRVCDGFLTLDSDALNGRSGQAKYFININNEHVGQPVAIEAFTADSHLRIIADGVAASQIDREHAFIEIFQSTDSGMHELEMHGPIHELSPGDGMRFVQTLELRAYDGANSMDAQVAALSMMRRMTK